MRHMQHTKQTLSFDVALILEEDFLTRVFGELEITIEFTGVKVI